MTHLPLKLAAALLGAAGLAVGLGTGAALGYWRGHAAGKTQALAAHHAQTVAALARTLAEHQALVQQSQQASAALRQAVAEQFELDLSTTKELADALAKTAAHRAGCRLDAGLMRQLAAARERAARAAARSFDGAVPGTAADGRP